MTLVAYSSARHEDLRDAVAKIVQEKNNRVLELFLVQDMAATDTTHKWVNKQLNGYKDTLQADITNSGTTVTVAAGSTKRMINGKTYMKIDDEVMKLTAGASTNSLTVVRAQFSTTGVAHTAGSDVLFFEHVHSEGADNSRDDSQVGTKVSNFCQIFRRELKLSGTSQAVNSVGNDNSWGNQVQELLAELLQELRLTFIQGQYSGNADESVRTMGGLNYFATNAQDKGGNPLTTAMFDTAIEQLLDNGADASDLLILAPTRQIRKINDLKIARVIGGGMADTNNTIRNNVDQYEFSDALVKVLRIPELSKNELYIGQRGSCKIVPLKDRSFRVQEIGQVGDSVQKLLVGEYTAEVMNATKTWVRFKNLGV